MKSISKVASLILCMSFMASICSCEALQRQPKETEDLTAPAIELADDLGKYIVQKDYDSIEAMSVEGDEELATIMAELSDADSFEEAARMDISETLEYKVLADSATASEDGDQASVEIQFEYADYEKLISDVPYVGMTPFTEALEACTDKIEKTLTFEFEKNEDGKMLLTNISDIKELYPYVDTDFNFAEALYSYFTPITFSGITYDSTTNVYCDTNSISFSTDITGDGALLTWDYKIIVKVNGETVYESEVVSETGITSVSGQYPTPDQVTDELLADGEYEVSVTDASGNAYISGAVTVTHTEEPEPEPVSYEFYCPEGDSTVLPGTSYRLTVQNGIEFRDADYETLQHVMENGNPNHMVVHADDGMYGVQSISADYIPDAHSVDDPIAQEELQEHVDDVQEYVISQNFPNMIVETRDVTIGDVTYQISMVDEGESSRGLNWAWGYMLIEQNGNVYLICIDGMDIDNIMELTNCITVEDAGPRV